MRQNSFKSLSINFLNFIIFSAATLFPLGVELDDSGFDIDQLEGVVGEKLINLTDEDFMK